MFLTFNQSSTIGTVPHNFNYFKTIGTVFLDFNYFNTMEHYTQINLSRTMMADHDNTQCPWTTFFVNAITLLETLHDETYSPQTKITKFINAAKCHFARSPTKGKKSKKQFKKVVYIPNNKQPCHTVSSSKQKDMAINRQSCQPITTSYKNMESHSSPLYHVSLHLPATGQESYPSPL